MNIIDSLLSIEKDELPINQMHIEIQNIKKTMNESILTDILEFLLELFQLKILDKKTTKQIEQLLSCTSDN
jgi:hypothetical protein